MHNLFVPLFGQRIRCNQRPANHPTDIPLPYSKTFKNNEMDISTQPPELTETHTQIYKYVYIWARMHKTPLKPCQNGRLTNNGMQGEINIRLDTVHRCSISILVKNCISPRLLPHGEIGGGLHGTRTRTRHDEATLFLYTQTLHLCKNGRIRLRSQSLHVKPEYGKVPRHK